MRDWWFYNDYAVHDDSIDRRMGSREAYLVRRFIAHPEMNQDLRRSYNYEPLLRQEAWDKGLPSFRSIHGTTKGARPRNEFGMGSGRCLDSRGHQVRSQKHLPLPHDAPDNGRLVLEPAAKAHRHVLHRV